MKHSTMCQDCLAELVFDNSNLMNDGCSLCTCGGDVCDCPDCLRTLSLLKQGERDFQKLRLIRSIEAFEWTADSGLKLRSA